MGQSHTIAFLVFDGVKMLDIAGPAEVFAEANKLGARYSLTYVSSTGEPVSTSIGLPLRVDALALVERDHGASIARLVAQRLVLFMRRPGSQSQFSAPPSIPTPDNEPLRKAVELISARPSADYSSASLGEVMGLSPRQVARLFAAELDTSPAKFVEPMRLDHAKAMLAAGHSISKTAAAAGFGSTETMRRIFNQRLHASPSEYRARFHTARFPNEAKGWLQPS